MRRTYTLILFSIACAAVAVAQPVVAPTNEQVGPVRGTDVGGYNVTNSFELGYRFASISGNEGLYRSDVNYGNGLRLLGSNLTIDSKEGHGGLFDELLLNTLGLGNDPYEYVSLRIRKNRLYRYDMTWRQNQFFDPGVVVSGGEHLMNTTRILQDHDLTFLPDNRVVQFDIGYSRNTLTGPGLTTTQEFDTRSVAFPAFSNIRQQYNDYRAGAMVHFAGFTMNVRRTWEFFKQDTVDNLNGIEGSGITGDPTVLQQFARSQPFHGSNGAWLGTLFGRRKYWAVNARMSYSSGSGDFALNELATGVNRFGAAANRDITVSGDAQRPTLAGDFNVSIFPTEKFTIVNHTAVSNIRIDGNSDYAEFNMNTSTLDLLQFTFLGVRTVSNTTDLHYHFNKWLGAYAGYNFSDRQIRVEEAFVLPGVPNGTGNNLYPQVATLSSVLGGVRLQLLKGWTTNLEAEVGHNSAALTPISDRNYHTLSGRTQYRVKKLQLGANYQQFYNQNAPLSFTTYSSRSRQTSASATWAFNRWLSLDTSYSKLHLDTVGGLQFFAGTPDQLQTGFDSLFISNIHAGNAGVRISLLKRADLFLGYSITKDTGDGRSTPSAPGSTGVSALLQSVQTFPLTYQSPMARVSIRLSPKLRWNAAWQYYGYNEQFQLFSYYENYHANTGFTSILWSF